MMSCLSGRRREPFDQKHYASDTKATRLPLLAWFYYCPPLSWCLASWREGDNHSIRNTTYLTPQQSGVHCWLGFSGVYLLPQNNLLMRCNTHLIPKHQGISGWLGLSAVYLLQDNMDQGWWKEPYDFTLHTLASQQWSILAVLTHKVHLLDCSVLDLGEQERITGINWHINITYLGQKKRVILSHFSPQAVNLLGHVLDDVKTQAACSFSAAFLWPLLVILSHRMHGFVMRSANSALQWCLHKHHYQGVCSRHIKISKPAQDATALTPQYWPQPTHLWKHVQHLTLFTAARPRLESLNGHVVSYTWFPHGPLYWFPKLCCPLTIQWSMQYLTE